MNINTETFKTANERASLKLNGMLIDLCGEVALVRRASSPYSDQGRSYVVTHYSTMNFCFYWSTYDLTLTEAVELFTEKTTTISERV